MAHIDRIESKPSLLSSFFSGEHKNTGLFEAVMVAFGGLAISVFLIAAHFLPVVTQPGAAP